MPTPRVPSFALLAASLLLMLPLAGCSDDGVIYDNIPSTPVSGNWQISNSGTGTVPVPSLSGALTGSGTAVTGILHADESTGCAAAADPIPVSGSTTVAGITTLTGPIAGGTLTVTGTLSTNGASLTGATYTISGGQCAFAQTAQANVQSYSPVTGTYTGNFSDLGGQVISVTANLTQSPSGDSDGNFSLSGTGSFGTNACFASPVNVSNAQVTGGTFTLTYADATTGNSVTATGVFAPDGTTLTVTGWTLTGPCGADSGTGVLTQQAATD